MTDDEISADIAWRNSVSMLRLARTYNILFPRKEAHLWRPTKETTGDIPGVASGLTILCTDGTVAYFRRHDDTLFYGHLARFTGAIEPLHQKADYGCADGTSAPVERKRRRNPTAKTPQRKNYTAVAVAELQRIAKDLGIEK